MYAKEPSSAWNPRMKAPKTRSPSRRQHGYNGCPRLGASHPDSSGSLVWIPDSQSNLLLFFGFPYGQQRAVVLVMHACMLSYFSRVPLCATPWTVSCRVPLSMGFSRQEYWSGLLCPPPGDLPDPGIEPASLTSPALAVGFFTTSTI